MFAGIIDLDTRVKKCEFVVYTLLLCELDVALDTVDVFKETILFSSVDYYKSVVYVAYSLNSKEWKGQSSLEWLFGSIKKIDIFNLPRVKITYFP